MKQHGLRRSHACKCIAVLLFVITTITGILSGGAMMLFYEEEIYTGSKENARKELIENLCYTDIMRLEDHYQSVLVQNGYLDPTVPDNVKENMLKNFMQQYQKQETNFFFDITDIEGNVILNSEHTDSRYSFTCPFYDEKSTITPLVMTLEEWENYEIPANTSVEDLYITEYYPEDVEDEQDHYIYDEDGYVVAEIRPTEQGVPQERTNYVCATLHTYSSTLSHYITGYVRSDFTAEDQYSKQLYFQGLMSDHAAVPVAVGIVSALLWLVCFVYLISSAGYTETAEQPVGSVMEKVPFDVFTVCLVVIAALLIGITGEVIGEFPSVVMVCGVAGMLTMCMLVVLWWIYSLMIRIRIGNLFSNNLIVRIPKRIYHEIRRLNGQLHQQVSITWQSVLGLLGFFIAELFCLIVFQWGGTFFLLNLLILIAAVAVTMNMSILEEGMQHISDGDLSYKVTEKKPLVGPFVKYAHYLNHISESMNKAVSERLKSETFKTELIANVSHDIRTPLTSIVNYADLLSKLDLQNPQAEEYIEVLTRQSARLRKLTEDVLEASKATTGNIKVNYEKLNLSVLLEQMIGEYSERFESKQLQLVTNIPDTALYLSADSRLLWRVMDNLFGNICKYAMPNSRVYLDANTEENQIVCTLRNISAAPLNISSDALLERFVQGDRSRNTDGSGLGLSIAQSLTAVQGGSLTLQIDGDLFKVIIRFPEMRF